jgi:hypothetical protein
VRTYLILDQELDTLDRSSSGFRDGGRDTTHCYHESVSENLNSSGQKHHPSTTSTAIVVVGSWQRDRRTQEVDNERRTVEKRVSLGFFWGRELRWIKFERSAIEP